MKTYRTMIGFPRAETKVDVGTGLTAKLAAGSSLKSYSAVHFVVDATVARLHGAGLLRPLIGNRTFYALPSGERQKNINSAARLLRWLHDQQADRRSLLFAIGGGVVTDLAGFAASTYMRGIDYISLPTTLVSQLDAAIGGKTAINLGGTKNIAGTFYPPKRVLCDRDFLATLRPVQILDGLVEAIKIFAACDRAAFRKHSSMLDVYKSGADLIDLISVAVRLKVDIVNRDPFEKDLRRLLNFGHTAGHAYEAITGHSHGKSVAFGILVALNLSRELAKLNSADYDSVKAAILLLYRRFAADGITAPALWERILHDKKKSGTAVNFVLLKTCGGHVVKSVNYPQFAHAFKQTREMLES